MPWMDDSQLPETVQKLLTAGSNSSLVIVFLARLKHRQKLKGNKTMPLLLESWLLLIFVFLIVLGIVWLIWGRN